MTTAHGLPFPPPSATPDVPRDLRMLAEAVDAALSLPGAGAVWGTIDPGKPIRLVAGTINVSTNAADSKFSVPHPFGVCLVYATATYNLKGAAGGFGVCALLVDESGPESARFLLSSPNGAPAGALSFSTSYMVLGQ